MKNSNQNTEKQTEFGRYEIFVPDSEEYNEDFMYSFLNNLAQKYGIQYEVYAKGQDTGFGTEHLVNYYLPETMGFDDSNFTAISDFNDFLQKEWFIYWQIFTGIDIQRWDAANNGYDEIEIGIDCLKAIYKMRGIKSNPIEDLYSIYFEHYFEGNDEQKAELIAEVENDSSLNIWKKGNMITSHVYIDGFGEGEINLDKL